MKAGRREMTKLKRRKEPTGVRSRGSSMAELQEQLDRRTRELNEALDHQTAASAVLRTYLKIARRSRSAINVG
jgi:hypothetical protein